MEIKFDKRNYRIHDDRNKELISKSLDECGAGRSIVVDNDGEIIGGNGIYEAWGDKPVKVVETDGSELVVVKRTDLKTSDEKRKKLAVLDNSTSDSSRFDKELLSSDFTIEELNEMGVEDIGINEIEENLGSDELKKDLNDFRGLIYEKQGECPSLSSCLVENNIKEMEEKINDSNATDEEKEFMKKALTRFYRFNFRNIAEYYCHSSNEVKKLFEELILVIPDGKKLLRNSLLELDSIIQEEAEND